MKAEGEEGSDADEEEDSGPLSQLKLLVESAYFASKHPCKLCPTAGTKAADLSPVDRATAAAEKSRALSSVKQEELE